jgi:DnaJ-class molecular chaperone
MDDKRVRKCKECHGNGKIYKEDPPGVWKWIKCPAGCDNGKVNIGTI